MITLADPMCRRCKLVLEEHDLRPWFAAGADLICPGCITERDLDVEVVESFGATHRARLARGYACDLTGTIRMLEDRLAADDLEAVWSYLRWMADQPNGVDALAHIAFAAISFLEGES